MHIKTRVAVAWPDLFYKLLFYTLAWPTLFKLDLFKFKTRLYQAVNRYHFYLFKPNMDTY